VTEWPPPISEVKMNEALEKVRKERVAEQAARQAAVATRGGFATHVHGDQLVIANGKDYMFAANLKMQASELDKFLPRSLTLLTGIVDDPKTPVEWRAKMLEVMVFRGATNEYSYDWMRRDSDLDMSLERMGSFMEREAEFNERRAYQEAARDAIFGHPKVFDQLTRSPDQLPQGRSAATEIMNTLLRNGGIYGNDNARQEFERRVLAVEPETRGRMMQHMEDAGRSSDIHLKGEKQYTGYSGELSAGNSAFSLGIGFGAQWQYVADNHWREAGNDVRRAVATDFIERIDSKDPGVREKAQSDLAQFEKGYKDTEARDRMPRVTSPSPSN
jgi:hypothetical protein